MTVRTTSPGLATLVIALVALVGDEGMLLVDTGIASARDRIAIALGGFDRQPLR